MTNPLPTTPETVPVREDIFTRPLHPFDQVHLVGTRCRSCGEVSLGKVAACPNCVGQDLQETALSKRGHLWTYTVIRNRPPGDYKGPDPFIPFGLGLVELPEGIRVLSPIQCDVKDLKIGMKLELEVYKLFTDDERKEVVAFRFKPVG